MARAARVLPDAEHAGKGSPKTPISKTLRESFGTLLPPLEKGNGSDILTGIHGHYWSTAAYPPPEL
jgi:hypothetical protein